ncbi:MAG: hypothetical protein JXR66_09815 [Bacteroidales bacterium]|nr:hypothetical protein [Bacteroidales bacterium]MBN2633841.1 hypothetical protein [Bacteroidales bacterium]
MCIINYCHKAVLIVPLFLLLNIADSSAQQDTLIVGTPSGKSFRAEPLRATMLAVALPGLGQIYNRKYWKVPLVYAGFAGVIYAIDFNTSRYNTFLKAYQDLTDAFPETKSYLDLEGLQGIDPSDFDPVQNPSGYSWYKDRILRMVDYHRKYRDLSYIGIAAWYLITILDANVDASLSDYDISDNLDLEIGPVTLPVMGQLPSGMCLTMRVTF